jgi:dGTPase
VSVSLRETLEKEEDRRLAPWGARVSRSRGRLFSEPEHPYRTAFQRDRDRIIHSTAFRRLQYKTQVFVYHEGDHFRNRLTHTLEVAQIARTIARALGANEDLTEAIVLAHDLGHTPFGHSGERVLHRLLKEQGGFEHNRQSLRIVDFLELRSEAYRGLNLTCETREGLLKHGASSESYPHPVPWPEAGRCASLEAQIADAADEIAYHNHDIDDGLRSGLLIFDRLTDLQLWRWAVERARAQGSNELRILQRHAIRALIDLLVTDLVQSTRQRLEERRVASSDEVRNADAPIVGFSADRSGPKRELSAFLIENLYHHFRVVRMSAKAERILSDLWTAYLQDERLLPDHVRSAGEETARERVIADYIAGMTDPFAMEEHRRLFEPAAHV